MFSKRVFRNSLCASKVRFTCIFTYLDMPAEGPYSRLAVILQMLTPEVKLKNPWIGPPQTNHLVDN